MARTKAAAQAAPIAPTEEDEGPEMVEREVLRPQPPVDIEPVENPLKPIDLMHPQEDSDEQRDYYAAQLLGSQGKGPKFANIEDFRRRRAIR